MFVLAYFYVLLTLFVLEISAFNNQTLQTISPGVGDQGEGASGFRQRRNEVARHFARYPQGIAYYVLRR